MYFPKTGELQTFWTHYHCEDEKCPGKIKGGSTKKGETTHPWVRAYERTKEVQAWLDGQNRDSPTYTEYSPEAPR